MSTIGAPLDQGPMQTKPNQPKCTKYFSPCPNRATDQLCAVPTKKTSSSSSSSSLSLATWGRRLWTRASKSRSNTVPKADAGAIESVRAGSGTNGFGCLARDRIASRRNRNQRGETRGSILGGARPKFRVWLCRRSATGRPRSRQRRRHRSTRWPDQDVTRKSKQDKSTASIKISLRPEPESRALDGDTEKDVRPLLDRFSGRSQPFAVD